MKGVTAFAKALHHAKRLWHQSPIGHRSDYSVERLLAYRDYYQRTSSSRAVAVCLLTPAPAIVVALLIDCIPLSPPSAGWRENKAAWFRLFLEAIAVAMGIAAQVKEVIMTGAISNLGMITIGLGTAVAYISMTIGVAATWRFPIPFGYVLLVPPFLTLFWIFTLAVIGSHAVSNSKELRRQLKFQILVIVAQGLVSIAYPFFSALFQRLSGIQQAGFVFVTPLIKFVAKQIIASAAKSLHEYVGPIVVFSVDVFNVFYVATCMQTAKSAATTLLIILSDSFHVVVALRSIFQHIKVVKTKRSLASATDLSATESINYLHDLPGMVRAVCEELHDPKASGNGIRVFSPFPLVLSTDSVAFINDITRTKRERHVYSSSRLLSSTLFTLEPIRTTEEPAEVALTPVMIREMKQSRVIPVNSPTRQHIPLCQLKGSFDRKGSTSRRLLTLMHPDTKVSSTALRATLAHGSTREAVQDALQSLFHSEYLLLAEYIECALPIYYAIYLSVLFHLPVAKYYPHTNSLPSEQLTKTLINILTFGAIEFLAFLGMAVLLKRKLGISPLHQLAFVLETQARALQGYLFVWILFILFMPLQHFGKVVAVVVVLINVASILTRSLVVLISGVDFNARLV